MFKNRDFCGKMAVDHSHTLTTRLSNTLHDSDDAISRVYQLTHGMSGNMSAGLLSDYVKMAILLELIPQRISTKWKVECGRRMQCSKQ
jgi:hypothetical protein